MVWYYTTIVTARLKNQVNKALDNTKRNLKSLNCSSQYYI